MAAAREAGLVGRRRVLDSTALFDAVATIDTVTLIRSAIRGVLAVYASWEERALRGEQITLARYTHALPEDIEHARKLLDAYLADRQHRPGTRR